MKILLFLVLFLNFSFTVSAQELRMLPNRLQFRGATPGGQVAFFGWTVETRSFFPRLMHRRALVEDEDGDGLVDWEPVAPLPEYGYWVAFDLPSGRWTKLLPPFVSAGEGAGLVSAPTAGARTLSFQGFKEIPAVLGIWLVRPGRGLWGSLVRDGSRADGDGTVNGELVVALGELEPVDRSDRLAELMEGDWLFWAEVRTFAYGAAMVPLREGSK